MKTHVVLLAIVLALVGCKDKKNEKAETPPAPEKGPAKDAAPEPPVSKEAGTLPTVPGAATRNDVRAVVFVRIAADGSLTVGEIPEDAIDGGALVGELPAGAATTLEGLQDAIAALDPPARGNWRKQKAISDANHAGIIAPTPPAWPRAGDLHAHGSPGADDDPWSPIVFAAPELPAPRLLEVIRAGRRGAEIAVRTDAGAIHLLEPYIRHVTFGSGTEEPSEVLVVIRPGDEPVAVFDKAIADKKRTPESGDPWVRLQPGEGVTAGELIVAIGALDAHSPLGVVLGQPVAPPPTTILGE
jgi:hypothetical protein